MIKEYKPVTSLVNGEVISDLLNLCNDQFINPMIQVFAGSNPECLYCATVETKKHKLEHLDECPVSIYEGIVEKHKRWIVEK